MQNAEEMELRDERVAVKDKEKKERRKARALAEGESVSESSSSSEEESSGEEEEVKVKKKAGIAAHLEGFETANPNAVNKSLQTMKISNMTAMDAGDGTAGLSRKEREILDAEKQQRAYEKRHAAGETAEAKVSRYAWLRWLLLLLLLLLWLPAATAGWYGCCLLCCCARAFLSLPHFSLACTGAVCFF